jgi:hypothetical protein
MKISEKRRVNGMNRLPLLEDLVANLNYDQWGLAIAWLLIFGLFVAFLPFRKKSKIQPTSMYIAFIVASAFEMFGIPLSMYVVTWAFGVNLPQGLLWGHTLQQYIGYWGMYIGFAFNIIGGYLIYPEMSTRHTARGFQCS